MKLISKLVLVAIMTSLIQSCDSKDDPLAKITGEGGHEDQKNSGNDSSASSGGNGNLEKVSYVDTPLVEEFLGLVDTITARAPQLNRERDRRGKLRAALSTNLGTGCMQDVKVKNIEVIVEGQKLGNIDVSQKFSERDLPPTETGKTTFEFSFGDSTFTSVLTFFNDENKNALFGIGTRKSWIPTQDDFTIGKIQRIKIKKLANAFISSERCEGGGSFSNCKKITKVSETERYHLSSLKIKVNGELIFDRGNIDHIFSSFLHNTEAAKSFNLGWSDDHLNINEAYIKMKQRDDCTSFQ